MNDIIDLLFYILGKFWSFLFGSYIIDGVSIGMLFICSLIMSMLIRYLILIPKAMRFERRSPWYEAYHIYYDKEDTSYNTFKRDKHYK